MAHNSTTTDQTVSPAEFADLDDAHEALTDTERRGAVEKVKQGSTKARDVMDATAWFLSDEDAGEMAVDEFELNVGAKAERFVRWRVQAISRERIRQIRRLSMPARQRAAGGGQVDDVKANLMIAAEGTIEPDLTEIAGGIGTSAMDVLARRFAHKPGLIDQIADRVVTVSGYDNEDIREAGTVRD